MKVSGKMTKSMATVRKRDLLNYLLIQTFFGNAKGKLFRNNEIRYEGKWKDGKEHGYGKKRDLINNLLILPLFDDTKGKLFLNK